MITVTKIKSTRSTLSSRSCVIVNNNKFVIINSSQEICPRITTLETLQCMQIYKIMMFPRQIRHRFGQRINTEERAEDARGKLFLPREESSWLRRNRVHAASARYVERVAWEKKSSR